MQASEVAFDCGCHDPQDLPWQELCRCRSTLREMRANLLREMMTYGLGIFIVSSITTVGLIFRSETSPRNLLLNVAALLLAVLLVATINCLFDIISTIRQERLFRNEMQKRQMLDRQ